MFIICISHLWCIQLKYQMKFPMKITWSKNLLCIQENLKPGKMYLIRAFIFEATTILIFKTQVAAVTKNKPKPTSLFIQYHSSSLIQYSCRRTHEVNQHVLGIRVLYAVSFGDYIPCLIHHISLTIVCFLPGTLLILMGK